MVSSREGAIKGSKSGYSVARNVRTGKVMHKRPHDSDILTLTGHAWCYMNKATERFLVRGEAGVEFLSTENDSGYAHHFIPGTCQYGILPCNGLLYVPPHSCACYINAKLNGFTALAPKNTSGIYTRKEPALEKGEAYSEASRQTSTYSNADWPTFRADAERSLSVSAIIGDAPTKKWEREVPGKLSSPVYADGRLYVSSIDSHTVYALNGKNGSVVWSYIAGGRIDTPPTIHKGLVLFGSADGWVYCLRASDAKLVWRLRASDVDLRMVSYGQIESVWPVTGERGIPIPRQFSAICKDTRRLGGRFNGEQLLSAEYVKQIMDRKKGDGYFYYFHNRAQKAGDKKVYFISGIGAGGQYMTTFPELNVVAVATAHNKGEIRLPLQAVLEHLVPLFTKRDAAESNGKYLFILSGQSNMQGMYQSMMQKIAAETKGAKPKAIAFCWMQGERDARERHSAVYESSLKQLFSQLKEDFPGIPMVFVIGKLSDFGEDNKQEFYPEWEEVCRAQEKVAGDTPNCTIVRTDDLNTGASPPHWKTKTVTQRVDDLHMSADGYKILGSRFAEKSIKLMQKVVPQ